MSKDTLKVVIPMGGVGSRLRPHTWSKPKQLVSVAGKAVLGHVLDMFTALPDPGNVELVNIVGYLGEQIEAFVNESYPQFPSHYVSQEDPRGQSHAIYLAREYLHGPMLMIFPDAVIETDLSFLAHESMDAIAWVKPVPDPRRFGVAKLGADNLVTQLIEKPADLTNNLAVVGFYYFREAEKLVSAIEEQMRLDIQFKGEYFLADAVNIMLKGGLKMRTEEVNVWLDAGTPAALLDTNVYLLDHGCENMRDQQCDRSFVIVPPVFIHPTAHIKQSVIGPHASIGADCVVQNSVIFNSILEDGAQVAGVIMEKSLIGRKAQIERRPGVMNVGDHTALTV